jgi:lipopolysaccharide assembly outer membrane protein LptD (OstA)
LAVALCALLLCAGAPATGTAQIPETPFSDDEGPYQLTAESIEYERARELYVARGDVTIRQADRSLRADWMAFSDVTQRGVASGNVIFVDGGETLYTNFVEFNISTLQGILFDARFEDVEGQFRLSGAEIAKTGEDTYRFKDGSFTTCRCPDEGREPWKIEADEAELEIEGYGTARNTTFEVLGVPAVWLPWMIYPLKTKRSTGFLLPDFKAGSLSGARVALPFFWAARENLNVTATPGWSGKRGLKGDMEIEYLLGERSGGELFGSYAYDEEIDPNSIKEPFGRNRWAAVGKQDQFLPGDVRLKTDLAFISDNQWVLDFDGLRRHRADRYLEATAFATRHFAADGRFGLVGSATYNDDLQSPDDLDRDKYIQQRLPEVSFYDLPAPLPWVEHIVPSLDIDYTYFTRLEDPTEKLGSDNVSANGLFLDTGIDAQPNTRNDPLDFYERNTATGLPEGGDPSNDDDDPVTIQQEGPEGNGLFEEGEPLRDKGHRMVLAPRLAVPFRIADVVEVYPEVGWSQTLYQSEERDFEQRGFATALVDVRTRVRRRFGESTTHVVEPHLAYAYLMDTSQSDNPLFVPPTAVPQMRLRQLDLQNVLRDPADRIAEFNGVTLGFGNEFWRDPGSGKGPSRLLADFTLSAGYDIAKSEFGWVILYGQAYPGAGIRSRFVAGFDPEDAVFQEGWLSFDWESDAGHRVGVDYRYLREIPRFFEDFRFSSERFDDFESGFNRVNQLGVNLRFLIIQRWALAYRIAYSFEDSLLLGNRGSIEYISRCHCWAAGIEVSQSRARGVEFAVLYRLLGLGQEFLSGSSGLGVLDAL